MNLIRALNADQVKNFSRGQSASQPAVYRAQNPRRLKNWR
jgi:hypothetical protein